MDVSQYLEIFIDETKEHLQTLSDQLMILETEPDNMETINEIFRAAHSLKGMAGTMGYKRMQRLTHDMENVFQEIRSGNMKVQPELIDVLFRGLDALEGYLANILESADEGTEDNEEIINTLNSIADKAKGGTGEVPVPTPTAAPSDDKSAASDGNKAKYENIRISDYEKATFEKAKEENINFVGNVEGRDAFTGKLDILVADGFTGNIFLKTVEGVGKLVKKSLKDNIKKNIFRTIGAIPALPVINGLSKEMSYKEYGGALFLGVKKPVVKAHGSSDEKLFEFTIKQAEQFVKNKAVEKLTEEFEK